MAANRIMDDDLELHVLDRLAENGWQALMSLRKGDQNVFRR